MLILLVLTGRSCNKEGHQSRHIIIVQGGADGHQRVPGGVHPRADEVLQARVNALGIADTAQLPGDGSLQQGLPPAQHSGRAQVLQVHLR